MGYVCLAKYESAVLDEMPKKNMSHSARERKRTEAEVSF